MAFSSQAADHLKQTLEGAAIILRDQSISRRLNAESAAEDFVGYFARLFTAACFAEAQDRPKLASEFETLALTVGIVAEQADRERNRIRDLAAWREREDERARDRLSGDPLQGIEDFTASIFDPKPSEIAIRPVSLEAKFSPRERQRTGFSSAQGTSSADPEALRNFASGQRGLDQALVSELTRTRNAWASFLSSCSWATVGSVNVFDGFQKLLDENSLDSTWAENIAGAFENAGGGSLSNLVLSMVGGSQLPPGVAQLLDSDLTSAQVAEAWATLGLTRADMQAFPIDVQFELSNLDGLPASARDVFSRGVLNYAAKEPEFVYNLMNLQTSPLTLEEFQSQVNDMQTAVSRADSFALSLPGGADNQVAQLIGFGVHNGALISGLSLGNLDTANNVTMNVPGMNTTVSGMQGLVGTANSLFSSSYRVQPNTYAIVSWIGYQSADFGTVGSNDRAEAGGANLAGFIDGVYDSRGVTPPDSFTVLGHSYGSTTVSEGLQLTDHQITNLITYGSVGFENGLGPDDLNVENIYATEASEDGVAIWGRNASFWHRTDPREIEGVTEFSSEANPERNTDSVTGHDMNPGDDGGVGYLTPGSEAHFNISYLIATGELP